MTPIRRVRPEAVALGPMPNPPAALCCACGEPMVGAGRFTVLVDGGPPCNRCGPRLIGADAAAFGDDLEGVAAMVATLPRGDQRRIGARLLYQAARMLLLQYGGGTDPDAVDSPSSGRIEAAGRG